MQEQDDIEPVLILVLRQYTSSWSWYCANTPGLGLSTAAKVSQAP